METSRILKKNNQILIRRNIDVDGLAKIIRNEDGPIIDSLKTFGFKRTPFEIPAADFPCYPLREIVALSDQIFVRRQKFGGIRPVTDSVVSRLLVGEQKVLKGEMLGCEIVSDLQADGISCDINFRYAGCLFRQPVRKRFLPLRQDDGTLFSRDLAAEGLLLDTFVSLGINVDDRGRFCVSYDQFLDLVKRVPENVNFITERAEKIYAHSSVRSSSGIQWFGEVSDEDLTGIVDAYLSDKRFVRLNGQIEIMRREDLSEVVQDVVKASEAKLPLSSGALIRLFSDLRIAEKVNATYQSDTWCPSESLIRMNLKDYQLHGCRWLRSLKAHGIGGILADEMGLGKTVQIIAAFAEDMLLSKKPSVIIAPASVVPNWESEIRKFCPDLSARIVLDVGQIVGGRVCILSYEKARSRIEELKRFDLSHLILDEGQKIKNADTISYRTLVGLRSDFRLVLTGTPIENSVAELWNHIGFVDPRTVGAFKLLVQRYACLETVEKRDKFSLLLLSPFVLARKKEDVLKGMPQKTEEIVHCAMGEQQQKLYERIRKAFLSQLKSGRGFSVPSLALEALLRLRECCCHPAILSTTLNSRRISESVKFNWVKNFVENRAQAGRKIIIFSQFVSVLSLLQGEIESLGLKCYSLTGESTHRQEVIVAFNQHEGSAVFLCSIKAGGFGINLTSASEVVLIDPWWNPAVEQQAFARAHRIGQKDDVHVYKLVCNGTVEEKILELQASKQKLSDGLKKSSLKVSEMVALLKS